MSDDADYDRAMEAEALLREIRRDQYMLDPDFAAAIDAYFGGAA